tara:strand:+ start:852 stop:1013 length:162 start_codon:yes stop_codon:yes gene_type:complete
MKPIFTALLLLLAMVCSVGCGSGEAKPAVESDELSQWVSENPAPEEVPLAGEK